MASTSKASPESLATAAFAEHAHPITPSSPLLSASLALPPSPRIAYAIFRPASAASASAADTIELGRRAIVAARKEQLLESVLCDVIVEGGDERMWVFKVASADEGARDIGQLKLDGLAALEAGSFSPDELFPPSDPSTSRGPSHLLPYDHLREPYGQFLQALTDALVDQMCSHSDGKICRYKDGVIFLPGDTSFEWGNGWEHYTHARPLVRCILHATLQRTRVLIQPLLSSTHFIPLVPSSLPPPGAPVALLPYATPAYFLTLYPGPSAALAAQFAQSLTGLGCNAPKHRSSTQGQAHSYAIVWVAVQNKQGEEKGLPVVWPAHLVLVHAQPKHALAVLPELAAQLQPSPPGVHPPPLSAVTASASTPTPLQAIDASTNNSAVASGASNTPTQPSLPLAPNRLRPARALSRKDVTTLQTLALSARTSDVPDLDAAVSAAGRFVDAAAKDRERERERLKREAELRRDGNTSGEAGMSGVQPTSAPVGMSVSGAMNSTSVPTSSATIGSAGIPTPATVPPPSESPATVQPYYPSPAAPPQSSTSVETFGAFDSWGDGAYSFNNAGFEGTGNIGGSGFSGNVDSSGFDGSSSSTVFGQDTSSHSFNDGVSGTTFDGKGDVGTEKAAATVQASSSWDTQMDIDGVGNDIDDIFTDADFDFWGEKQAAQARPALSVTTAHPHAHFAFDQAPSALSSAAALFSEPPPATGPGPPPPWFAVSASVPEELAPELLPPSPMRTPASATSAPATPEMALVPAALPPLTPGFEPIAFHSTQRVRDGKYAAGKFALPSPPDEEDRTEPVHFGGGGWYKRYAEKTDPREGVVKRIIGMKRKLAPLGNTVMKAGAWMRGSVDWERDVVPSPRADEDETMSDNEDDDEDDEDEDEDVPMDEDPPSIAQRRPSTPVPSYLPLGPTLLHSQFRHEHLLPIATPLKSASAVAATPPAATGAASVPTPVSPAALLGAASERSKTLEAAAHILAHEVVESAAWADAWRASVPDAFSSSTSYVSQADVRRIRRALECVSGVQSVLDIAAVFGIAEVARVDPPMLAVGKGDALVHVLPSALNFWQKLGLGPRAGKKDVVAFVFFEESVDGARLDAIEKWLSSVANTYQAANFGRHKAGYADGCVRDGLIPVKFDSFRKILSPFVSSLPAIKESYVFYITTPSSIISLSSPVLRQIFSAVKRAQKTYANAQILFHFLPAHLVYATSAPSVQASALMLLTCSVYDRLLRPADRAMSRRLFDHGARVRALCQEHAFVIAPPLHPQVHLVRQYPPLTLDVVERYALLHVGYRVCGHWLLAACTDHRGEAHDVGVWTLQPDASESHIATAVWDFASAFAKKASVEWRIVVAKLGLMTAKEINAWVDQLDDAVVEHEDLPMAHVSLIAVDQDASWTFAAQPPARPRNPSTSSRTSKSIGGTVLVDASVVTHLLTHPFRMDFLPPSSHEPSSLPYIPDPTDFPPSPYARTPIHPLRTATLIHSPPSSDVTATTMLHLHLLHVAQSERSTLSDDLAARTLTDVAENFHALAVLARSRALLARDGLPWHLAALEVIETALSGSGVGEL